MEKARTMDDFQVNFNNNNNCYQDADGKKSFDDLTCSGTLFFSINYYKTKFTVNYVE